MTHKFNVGDIVRRMYSADVYRIVETYREDGMDYIRLSDNKTFPAGGFLLTTPERKVLSYEEILPGDIIQIRVNPRPGYKGLTHDPMTVSSITPLSAPGPKFLWFSDSKSVIGHDDARSVYTLVSRG